jgi:transcriptional regulator with XRE-family HTH domain
MEFKGWNEKDLAEKMGVSYITIYRIMRKQRGLGKETIAKLLQTCKGADFDQLFIFENTLPKGNEEEQRDE